MIMVIANLYSATGEKDSSEARQT